MFSIPIAQISGIKSTVLFCVHLVMIPLEELQEAGLGPCGAFHASETQVILSSLKVAHVHDQVLQPQTRSLAHCSQLSWPERKRQSLGIYT